MKFSVGNININVADSYEQMSKLAADVMAAQILFKPTSVIGLATGSTPVGLYNELSLKHKSGLLDFSQVTSFNLDEYYPIKRENNQSFYYFMYDNLFKHINIPSENIHIPNGEAADIHAECKTYEDKLRAAGIDMQLVGIGNNGHIGFNEPADIFADGTFMVNLTQSTIEANSRFFKEISEVPTKAVTMGIGSVMSAKRVLFVANGAQKAEAVKQMLYGEITPQMPASALRMHRKVDMFITKDIYDLL